MYSVKLAWKDFNVDIPSVVAWAKALDSSSDGASTDNGLWLWFHSDVNQVPMHDVTHQRDVTVDVVTQVPTLDGEGNPVLDGNGNPMTHEETHQETHQEDYVVSEPTGEPSKADLIRAYWDALTPSSAEATTYTQKETMAAITRQVEAISDFSQKLLNQFAAENIAMGITADNKTEDVLDTMLPVMNALQGGAPTIAIKRAKAISPSAYDSKYVTAARLLAYVNKIEAFLGLPLSTSLS